MTKKGKFLRIISVAMVIGLLVVIIISMTKKEGSDKPIDEIAAPVAAAFENDLTVLGSDSDFKRYFGLNPSDYDGIVYYVPTSNLYATEMLIVKMKDENQAEELETAVKARLEYKKNIFDGYMSDQFSLCEDAVIDVNGNYILYAVGENAEATDKAFKEALK